MGGLYRRSPFRDNGHYVIPNGRSDVQFDFDYFLADVFISCLSTGLPVCNGDLNWVAVTILDQSFIIHADIRSDSADIAWMTVEGERGERRHERL